MVRGSFVPVLYRHRFWCGSGLASEMKISIPLLALAPQLAFGRAPGHPSWPSPPQPREVAWGSEEEQVVNPPMRKE